MATVSDVPCTKPVVVEAHFTRGEDLNRSQNAQVQEDRNSKSTRPCGDQSRKTSRAAPRRGKMDGETKTISACLRNPELWDLFHSQDTEMIITKAGRYVNVFHGVFWKEIQVYICRINSGSKEFNSTIRCFSSSIDLCTLPRRWSTQASFKTLQIWIFSKKRRKQKI